MSELRPLEALQALHAELVAVRQHRYDNIPVLEQLLEAQTPAFKKLIDKAPRNSAHRTELGKGKVKIDGEEYAVNEDFVNDCLKTADELDLDELEAARILLDCDAEGDVEIQSRPLWECGIIRFHQERRFLLDCIRLCLEIAADDELEPGLQDAFGAITEEKIFGIPAPGAPRTGEAKKFVPRCVEAIASVRSMLQSVTEKAAARNLLQQANLMRAPENQETIDFSRASLLEQHECLAAILHAAVEKRHATVDDFKNFLRSLKKVDKYDHFLVHMFPVLAAYVTAFGSPEGVGDLQQSRQLNQAICKPTDDDPWTLPYFGAAVRAWWIAEYSGWYIDDTAYDFQGINLDEEDEERNRQFQEALKEGAFDFILSLAADCRAQEWQDPARLGMRQWLPRKCPPLASDPFPFSHFLQQSLVVHLEAFIDAAISNLPDMLRKLRTEEDEQRQLSQNHEQDFDLERFLIIISYAYEGRPEAAMSFWEDPDSNLAGFLQWASRRASTPLVSAFCEMLQCLADNEECATAAHNFLLDEGHQASSGKMKRTQSLTWSQIFKELEYFTNRIREKPTPTPQNSLVQRPSRPGVDLIETEPESALMLECYLRLIAKLCTESDVARQRMIVDEEMHVVDTLFRLIDGPLPPRLRACVFYVFRALMTKKQVPESDALWRYIDAWATNTLQTTGAPQRVHFGQPQTPEGYMESLLNELGNNFEDANGFIQLLTSLFAPIEGDEGLNDNLAFPEDLGGSTRTPGIELYVDFVFRVFSQNSLDLPDPAQLRTTRLSCLEFALVCLSTFNEDLIILGNASNIAIDVAMPTTDLATYVRLHPFARVMEWLFNDKVVTALIKTIHQDPVALGAASPESPLVLGILRAVQVMIKALELQETYLHLVRPVIEALEPGQRRPSVASSALSSFEDGILSHLNLVVDLGKYCNLGHGELTLACLKLLEKISTSPRIISAWSPDTGRVGHRNKAIVQLERDGEGLAIAASLAASLQATMDPVLEAESEDYVIKLFILDFLYACLKATPDQPTIAHLLLGFRCELNRLSIEPGGVFDAQKSLFHALLNVVITLSVYQEEKGMRGYLIAIKFRILRILQVLWKSPLSGTLVMDELRATNFLFHMLLREVQIQPDLLWDGAVAGGPDFLLSPASVAYIDYLGARAMIFEYIGKELCSVSQNRIPSVKRQIFDALNGQIRIDNEEPIMLPTIFDFFDFLNPDTNWEVPTPDFTFYKDLDLRPSAIEHPEAGVQYDIHKVRETIALKRNEFRDTLQIAPPQHLEAIETEENILIEFLTFTNRQRLLAASRLTLLRSWANLLLVMFEANDFRGTPKMAFLLQALQAILPTLEAFSTLSPAEAFELARVAKVLLFKLDFSDQDDAGASTTAAKDRFAVGNLISDKLFQLFQVCLSSIGKWAGSAELRALYYGICYRYLTAVVDRDTVAAASLNRSARGLAAARAKTLKAIQIHGDRLLNVICDDALGSDTSCQTAATVLLSALVHTSLRATPTAEDDAHIIDALNRLNFIGVLVDSLKTILADWLSVNAALRSSAGTASEPPTIDPTAARTAEQYLRAKLALLQQIAQTRQGAKHVVQANLFRAIDVSGAFAADPELEVDASDARALERHYALLAALARVVAAAVLARGQHNVPQGRRFLTQHRGLVVHVLKKSAGIGVPSAPAPSASTVSAAASRVRNGGGLFDWWGVGNGDVVDAQQALEERIEELAEAFMLLITATGFLEFEEGQLSGESQIISGMTTLFH